jgi:chemotaxis protein MotB
MAGPPAPQAEEGGEDDWMGTYADAITLLMAFFVLFFSFSKVDLDTYDKVSKGLSASISKVKKETVSDQLSANMSDLIASEGAEDVVKKGTDSQGSITLELNSGAFFKPGSAIFQEQAIPVLTAMFEELASPIYAQFNLNIEGHTDDDPISTAQFPSNWELSTARASSVVRFFEASSETAEDKIESNRMRAIGYAQTQPKFANRNEAGEPIRDNQIANRRIVIRVSRVPIYVKVKIPTFRRPSPPPDEKAGKDAKK